MCVGVAVLLPPSLPPFLPSFFLSFFPSSLSPVTLRLEESICAHCTNTSCSLSAVVGVVLSRFALHSVSELQRDQAVSSQSCLATSPGRSGRRRELALNLWCSEATDAELLRPPHQGPMGEGITSTSAFEWKRLCRSRNGGLTCGYVHAFPCIRKT